MDWDHWISFKYDPWHVFTQNYDNNILHFFCNNSSFISFLVLTQFINTLWLLLYVLLAQASKNLVLNWIWDISGSPSGVFQWIEIIEFHSNMVHWMSLHTTMTIIFYIFFWNNSSFISILMLTLWYEVLKHKLC